MLGREVFNESEVPKATKAVGPSLTLGEIKSVLRAYPEADITLGFSDDCGFEGDLSLFGMFFQNGCLYISARCDTYMNTMDEVSFKGIEKDHIHFIPRGEGRTQKFLHLGYPDATPVFLAVRNDRRGRNRVFSKFGRHSFGPLVDIGPLVTTNFPTEDFEKRW